jgi:hypothetical protein
MPRLNHVERGYTAAIAEAKLFTNAGFDANTSRKKAAAVVKENHATH